MSDNPENPDPQGRSKDRDPARSELVRIEEALRSSEEKYKLVAEHSADVIYKLDITTEKYNCVSPSIEKMLGCSAEEALPLTAQDTVTERHI